jgi:hypothetical protein
MMQPREWHLSPAPRNSAVSAVAAAGASTPLLINLPLSTKASAVWILKRVLLLLRYHHKYYCRAKQPLRRTRGKMLPEHTHMLVSGNK